MVMWIALLRCPACREARDHTREGFKQIPELLLTLLQFRRQPVVLLGKWESKIPGISAPPAQHPFYGSKTLSVYFEPNMSGSRSTGIRLRAHAGMRNRNDLGPDDRTEPIGSLDGFTEVGGDREIRRAGRNHETRWKGNRAVSALNTSHHPLSPAGTPGRAVLLNLCLNSSTISEVSRGFDRRTIRPAQVE